MEKEISVSVVIPAYNCESTIKELLISIKQQGLRGYEVIVVNDGSKDGTLSVLYEMCVEMPNLLVIDQKNAGAPKARNLGMTKAKGKYIYLCDADDLVYPSGLMKMVEFAEKHQSDVVVGNVCSVDEKSNQHVYKGVVKRYEKLGQYKYYFCDPIPGTKLYRRAFLERNQIVFDDVKIGQDLNFYLKAVCSTDKVDWIDETVYFYRTSFSGISKTYKLENLLSIRDSIEGVIDYCKERNLYCGERLGFIEFVKMSNYLWQLKKKKNVRKEDYVILRKSLCGDVDVKKISSLKKQEYQMLTLVEFVLVKHFNLIIRNV